MGNNKHRGGQMPNKENRRCAILLLAAVAVVMLSIMLAFVVDIGRMLVQRNELQTGTDAGALAGALRLLQSPVGVADSAVATGNRNSVLGTAPNFQVGRMMCGVWDGLPVGGTTPNTWHAGSPHALPCVATDNAVQATGASPSNYLFNGVLNVAATTVRTTAVAWAAPLVTTSSCVKPWGIPYSLLLKRLDPANTDTTRDLTPTDIANLASLPRSSLRFMLKVGSPPTVPGNFGAVAIGGQGANVYRSNIATCNSVMVGPGTVLSTEPGNMVGPTKQGAAVLCQPLYSDGGCGNGHGGVGLPIKAPFWYQATSSQGRFDVTIKIVGSFMLDSVTSNAEVIGHFVGVTDSGPIGTTLGTLVRIVLVQ